MSEFIYSMAAPLFDRLAGDPAETDSGNLRTFGAIQSSIGRELHRLFNTRSSLGLADYEHGDATVLEYGVPEFSALSAQDALGLERLQAALLLAIERYEPRLVDVTVSVVPTERRKDLAQVRIGAQARVGVELRRVDFEMLLGEPGGPVKIV